MLAVYGDPEVMRFSLSGACTAEDARGRLHRLIEHQERHGFSKWGVGERSGALVGDCGVQLLEGGPDVELGFHLRRSVWGRGYATEAARACLEASFAGLGLDEVAPLAGVRFRGLMTMPPAVSDPEDARAWFSALRELRDRLAPAWAGRHDLAHLSMGTSQDYAVAAQEGATIVRVGGVLYGR